MKSLHKLFILSIVGILLLFTMSTALCEIGFVLESRPFAGSSSSSSSFTSFYSNYSITATGTGSAYLAAMTRFNVKSKFDKTVIAVKVRLYDIENKYSLSTASKSSSVVGDKIGLTSYYTFSSSNKFKFKAGQKCRYEVNRTGVPSDTISTYWGAISTTKNVKPETFLNNL